MRVKLYVHVDQVSQWKRPVSVGCLPDLVIFVHPIGYTAGHEKQLFTNISYRISDIAIPLMPAIQMTNAWICLFYRNGLVVYIFFCWPYTT